MIFPRPVSAFLLGALLASAPAFANEAMIATSEPTRIKTTFTTVDGEPIVAIPVMFRQTEAGTVEAMPINVSEFGKEGSGALGPSFSVRISNPMILSASFGWVFGVGESHSEDWSWDREGVIVEGELGIGGIKASLGVIAQKWVLIFPFGIDVKASVLHTWDSSWGFASNETFVGGEIDLFAMFVKASFGVFRRIGAEDWEASFGLGVGF